MGEKMIKEILYDILQDKKLQGNSSNWANWMSQLSIRTCRPCVEFHGTIVSLDVVGNKYEVEAHPNCECVYVPMRTKSAGTATNKGMDGVDVYLMIYQQLPNDYVTKKAARKNG